MENAVIGINGQHPPCNAEQTSPRPQVGKSLLFILTSGTPIRFFFPDHTWTLSTRFFLFISFSLSIVSRILSPSFCRMLSTNKNQVTLPSPLKLIFQFLVPYFVLQSQECRQVPGGTTPPPGSRSNSRILSEHSLYIHLHRAAPCTPDECSFGKCLHIWNSCTSFIQKIGQK